VLNAEQLRRLQAAAREIKVHPSINSYMLDIVAATRTHEELDLGVSTRGAIVLFRAVQCLAFLESRNFVIPDDVKRLAVPVLAHRIVCRGLVREGQRDRSRTVVRQILQKTPVPA
jgi:MoxR-like ATPase